MGTSKTSLMRLGLSVLHELPGSKKGFPSFENCGPEVLSPPKRGISSWTKSVSRRSLSKNQIRLSGSAHSPNQLFAGPLVSLTPGTYHRFRPTGS